MIQTTNQMIIHQLNIVIKGYQGHHQRINMNIPYRFPVLDFPHYTSTS